MTNVASVLEPKTTQRQLDTGLDGDYVEKMSDQLSGILADTYQMTVKSHIYHWNVVGPLFKPIHDLTEEHYNALFAATDVIAERVRALGSPAPVKISDIGNFAPNGTDIANLTAAEMVDDLIKSHQHAVKKMRDAAKLAGENEDVVTEDMLTERMAFHEEALWMLRSIVAK